MHERDFRGVTPPERPQFNPETTMSTSHNTHENHMQSQSLRADSNRGPLHYESTVPVPPRPLTPANDAAGGPGGSPQDRRGQAERPQNAPSAGRLALGAPPAPRSRISTLIALAREMNERQADQLVHQCRLHVTDAGCDGSPFCTSYCGRKIASADPDEGPHCVVCDDLSERDSRTASR